MRNASAIVALIASLGLVAPAVAQPPALRPMASDRPNVTNTPTTVDAGHVQLEVGALDRTREREDGVVQRTTSVGEANARIGVTSALEVNVIVRPHLSERISGGGSDERARGFGDTTVGAKLNLKGNDTLDGAGTWALALQPQLNLPTADDGLGAGKVEAGISVPFTLRLPAGFSMNLQPTLSRVRAEDGPFVTAYEGAVELDHDLGPLNLYAEYVWDGFGRGGGADEEVVNLGGTAQVGPNLLLDANVEFGLNRAAEDFRLLLGGSVRF